MSKVLGTIFTITGIIFGSPLDLFIGSLLRGHAARRANKRAERRARDAYNAALQDRLEMVDVLPDQARTLAMGRVRAVEGVRRKWTSGTNSEKLTLVVSFAGHQIDGYEQWYFDDVELTLDGSGWVQTAPYLQTRLKDRRATATLDVAGAATVVLPYTPASGSVRAVWQVFAADDYQEGDCTVGVSGTTVTLTGGRASAGVVLTYQSQESTSHGRIRPYLGTSTQSVGTDLAAEYPGKLTTTDHFRGMAVAVVDLLYNPDVYPQGRPNVTARYRAALLYDPRKDSTQPGGSGSHRLADPATWEWSECLALQAYHYARWQHGWALPAEEIRTADVVAAADACDASTSFDLAMPGGGTEVVTLPRYSGGIVIASDADPQAAMDEIVEAMAGRHGWSGGVWRLRAGIKAASVFTLDASWLVQALDASGEPRGDTVARLGNGIPRAQRLNRISGSCVDPDERWQVLPFPAVEDPVRIAAKGVLAGELEFQAVNHIAQAQNLCRIAIQESHAGFAGQLACGLQAWPLELFDVGTLELPRYGISGKTVEVTAWRWHPTEPVQLGVEEIADAFFNPDAELQGRDPAPDSNLPRPWDVPAIAGLAAVSAAVLQPDGTTLASVTLSWTEVTASAIVSGGFVEVGWQLAAENVALTVVRADTLAGHTLRGLPPGRRVVLTARNVNGLPVRGDWCASVSVVTAGDTTPPDMVQGFAVAELPGGLVFGWSRAPEADYAATVLQLHENGDEDTPWDDDMVPWYQGDATQRLMPWPADGVYAVLAKHKDHSGNLSAEPVRLLIEIAGQHIVSITRTWVQGTGEGATWMSSILDPENGEILGYEPAAWDGTGGGLLIDTPQIEEEAAAQAVIGPLADTAYTFTNSSGITNLRIEYLLAISWTNSTDRTVTVELAGEVGGARDSGPGAAYVHIFQSPTAPASGLFPGSVGPQRYQSIDAGYARYTYVDQAVLAPGQTVHLGLAAVIQAADGTATQVTVDGRLRATALKA